MAANIKATIFWHVTPWSLVDINKSFGKMYSFQNWRWAQYD